MPANSTDDPFNFDVSDGATEPRTSHSVTRARTGGIPARLADGLQAGADAIRQRRLAPNTGSPVNALVNDPALAVVSDTLATGMESSADWLRDADLDKLKEGVEQQVKKHPGRSLLVALGAGFLLAKVFRR